MYILTKSNRIINKDGKVIYYPLQEFIDEIVKRESCFICGANSNQKEFNNEHIIPKWILKRFNLFNQRISLPNGQLVKYSSYTIPCCLDCNRSLSKTYEVPLSRILKLSYNEIKENIGDEEIRLIFKWMCLIFIKTHLKDKEINFEQDNRIESLKLYETYNWNHFHHIYCVSRSHYSEAIIDDSVYGTFAFIPIIREEGEDEYDFADFHQGRVLSIKINDYALIAVLDDSGLCGDVYETTLKKIRGKKLSSWQLREVISNLAAINLNIKERPFFYSGMDKSGKYNISVNKPDNFTLLENKIITPGGFLIHFAEKKNNLNFSKEELRLIENNQVTFLFDENGNFLEYE